VALTNSVVVAGLQMRLQIDSPHAGIDSIRATDRSKGMMVTWNAGNGKLIMIDLSMENMIQPGQGPILTVRYRINASAPADTIRVSAREVTLSDPDGKAIPVRTVDGALTVKTR
jgi:hypothetical protein